MQELFHSSFDTALPIQNGCSFGSGLSNITQSPCVSLAAISFLVHLYYASHSQHPLPSQDAVLLLAICVYYSTLTYIRSPMYVYLKQHLWLSNLFSYLKKQLAKLSVSPYICATRNILLQQCFSIASVWP